MVVDHAAEKRREKNREAQRKFRDTRKREEEEQAASLAAMESEVGALEDHFSQLQEEKDSLQFKLVELQTAPCMPLPNVSLNNSLLPLADVEYVDQELIPPLVSTDLARSQTTAALSGLIFSISTSMLPSTKACKDIVWLTPFGMAKQRPTRR